MSECWNWTLYERLIRRRRRTWFFAWIIRGIGWGASRALHWWVSHGRLAVSKPEPNRWIEKLKQNKKQQFLQFIYFHCGARQRQKLTAFCNVSETNQNNCKLSKKERCLFSVTSPPLLQSEVCLSFSHFNASCINNTHGKNWNLLFTFCEKHYCKTLLVSRLVNGSSFHHIQSEIEAACLRNKGRHCTKTHLVPRSLYSFLSLLRFATTANDCLTGNSYWRNTWSDRAEWRPLNGHPAHKRFKIKLIYYHSSGAVWEGGRG